MSETASAQFGVNCDMPGLHFEDTCVTDEDCSEFPNTGKDILYEILSEPRKYGYIKVAKSVYFNFI